MPAKPLRVPRLGAASVTISISDADGLRVKHAQGHTLVHVQAENLVPSDWDTLWAGIRAIEHAGRARSVERNILHTADPVVVEGDELVIRGNHVGIIDSVMRPWMQDNNVRKWSMEDRGESVRYSFPELGDLEKVFATFGPWAKGRTFRNEYVDLLDGSAVVQIFTASADGETDDLMSTITSSEVSAD